MLETHFISKPSMQQRSTIYSQQHAPFCHKKKTNVN